MRHIDTMVTAFRDGFQSYFGARVLTEDFLPAFEAAAQAGIKKLEVGGGARFQALYFYCNEDAFDMMDTLRRAAGPEADLQTLARGINVVGLDSQSRDVIDLHARMFKKHGVSTIRNFDALNDVNNLIYSGERIVAAGLRHEVCVTMMGLPPGLEGAHDPDFYEKTLREILDAGIEFHSVCFKDASGTTAPAVVHESVRRARKLLGDDQHIVFHSHETAGLSISQYVSAIEGGANQVDCSLAPVSGGTCQPDLMTLWQALRGTDYDLGIDIAKIREVEQIFTECMDDYFVPPEALGVEPGVLLSPMPGGALTANTQMMRDNGILDRYPEVIAAMQEVVARGGFGTSVTPVSQFYFQQAFNNVMFGPWERFAEGYGKMVLGYFGSTPREPDPEIVALASEKMGLEPTKRAPIDINDEDPSKGIAAAVEMLAAAGIEKTDENVFIAATCKEKGIAFLSGEATVNVRKKAPEQTDAGSPRPSAVPNRSGPVSYTVTVNGVDHVVTVDGETAELAGERYSVAVSDPYEPPDSVARGTRSPGDSQTAARSGSAGEGPGAASSAAATRIDAPFPGLVLRVEAPVGTEVAEGTVVMVLESMKMETPISSPVAGRVTHVTHDSGDQVRAGELLVIVEADS